MTVRKKYTLEINCMEKYSSEKYTLENTVWKNRVKNKYTLRKKQFGKIHRSLPDLTHSENNIKDQS